MYRMLFHTLPVDICDFVAPSTSKNLPFQKTNLVITIYWHG